MMSNTEIRKYVKENIKGKYAKILGFGLLVGLISGIASGIVGALLGALSGNEVLGAIITGLAGAVTTPLTVGLYKAILNMIENKEAKIDNLFDYFQDFGNLFILGVICEIVIALINTVVPLVGIILEYFYMGMLYLYIFNPTTKPMDIIKNGFEKMKNNVWNAILLNLSYTWPMIVMILVAILIFVIGGTSNMINLITLTDLESLLTGNIVMVVIGVILFLACLVYSVFITPYVNMAQTIFYAQAVGTKSPNRLNTTANINQNVNQMNNQQNQTFYTPNTTARFCPQCGNKVDGNFCTNCGNKLN